MCGTPASLLINVIDQSVTLDPFYTGSIVDILRVLKHPLAQNLHQRHYTTQAPPADNKPNALNYSNITQKILSSAVLKVGTTSSIEISK